VTNFGEWICSAVHAEGVRHCAFEDRAGLSSGLLYRWRTGGHLPRLEIFIQVCEVLSRIRGEHVSSTVTEALMQVSDYRMALKRQER